MARHVMIVVPVIELIFSAIWGRHLREENSSAFLFDIRFSCRRHPAPGQYPRYPARYERQRRNAGPSATRKALRASGLDLEPGRGGVQVHDVGMIDRRFIHKQDLPEGILLPVAIAGTLFLSRTLTRLADVVCNAWRVLVERRLLVRQALPYPPRPRRVSVQRAVHIGIVETQPLFLGFIRSMYSYTTYAAQPVHRRQQFAVAGDIRKHAEIFCAPQG